MPMCSRARLISPSPRCARTAWALITLVVAAIPIMGMREALAQPAMVENVAFPRGEPDPPDADGDGIPDDIDACFGVDASGDQDFDGICTIGVAELAASDCCTPREFPGCEDPACVAVICPQDPFCCDVAWDQICVTLVIERCEGICELPSCTGGPANGCGDNCPQVPNPGQEDCDGDGEGDACETDTDHDGIPDDCDNCPLVGNSGQQDSDSDGWGNACDNCRFDANPDQADADDDGIGDACDVCLGSDFVGDFDGDGVCDDLDPCPNDTPDDTDGDGVCDSEDPCPHDNPDDSDADGICDSVDVCQGGDDRLDADSDGVADACDVCQGNDAAGDLDGDGVCDVMQIPCVDTDMDGVCDFFDICAAGDDQLDADADGVPDACDNCPDLPNPDQTDTDGDGTGDACEAVAGGLFVPEPCCCGGGLPLMMTLALLVLAFARRPRC